MTAEKLSEWGKGSTWNEIQMFFNNKEGKILDVACGTGLNMLDLKSNPDALYTDVIFPNIFLI